MFVQNILCHMSYHDTQLCDEIPIKCRMEREQAIRLRLENEKLQQENAHLRELLDIMHPPGPNQITTAGRLAPDSAPQCIDVDALQVTDGDRLRGATANELRADDGAGRRASGGGGLRAGRDDGLRAAASGAALRHENLLRCRVAQLERQVCRAEAELQVKIQIIHEPTLHSRLD